MTFRLQLVAVGDSGQEQVREIARLEREGVQLETLGLTLAEGKLILKNVQESVIQKQVHESLTRQRCCPDCGKLRQCKEALVQIYNSFAKPHASSSVTN